MPIRAGALLLAALTGVAAHGAFATPYVSCRAGANLPCLRLRGGFFKLPGGAGRGETATAEDFADEEPSGPKSPGRAAGAAEANRAAGAAAAGAGAEAPQVSVQQHVAEYALAGSLDGLRTGLGQSVGGQVNVFATTMLQSLAQMTSLAFASIMCSWRNRQKRRKAQGAMQPEDSSPAASGSASGEARKAGPCACFVTVPNAEVASRLAQAIVSDGAAACVNQIPGVMSTYSWEGKVQTEQEVLLVVKTMHERLPALQAIVKEGHPFDCPELVALDITAGLPQYLEWLLTSCSK